MWAEVEAGSCVEKWLSKLIKRGCSIEIFSVDRDDGTVEDDWCCVWCPEMNEFRHFRSSAEIADNCVGMKERIMTISCLKGKL